MISALRPFKLTYAIFELRLCNSCRSRKDDYSAVQCSWGITCINDSRFTRRAFEVTIKEWFRNRFRSSLRAQQVSGDPHGILEIIASLFPFV